MSWGTCYNGANNIHFDFPPIMSDGRNYANWQPGAVINEEIRQSENIKSNWQYRKFLQKNADGIIRQNQLDACNDCCSCPAIYGDNQPISNTPFLYKSCTEQTTPFGYENSDLKNTYLTVQQLQCRMVAPILTQDQYLTEGYPRAN
jgi:hypothetical protein